MLGDALLHFVTDFPVYFLECEEENLYLQPGNFNGNCVDYFASQIAIKVSQISLWKWRITIF